MAYSNYQVKPSDVAAFRRGVREGIASYSDSDLTEALTRWGGLSDLSSVWTVSYRAALNEARRRGITGKGEQE